MLFFEETFNSCDCGSKDAVDKKILRRVMGLVICAYRCEHCMPQFFSNPNTYLVVYRHPKNLDKIFDPLDEDYNAFLTQRYQLVPKVEWKITESLNKELDKLGDNLAAIRVFQKTPVEESDDSN